MGFTRVIYTDATTAEAATVLKNCGFSENSKGGLFTNPGSPVRIYVVWGKSVYFPELLERLDFPPRIQIHLKCKEGTSNIAELTCGAACGIRSLCPTSKIKVYDADRSLEIQDWASAGSP